MTPAAKDSRDALRVFESIVENSPDIISRLDLEGRYVYVNRAVEANPAGLTREDFIGRTPREIGAGDEAANLMEEAFRRAIETRSEQRIVFHGQSSAASRTFDMRIVPEFDENGELCGVVRINREITAIKESEERLQNLAEALPQLVWMMDKAGNAIYFNRRWYEFTGQTVEESHGDGWTAALHPDDREFAVRAWRSAIRGETPYDVQYRLRRHDGVYRWFLTRGVEVAERWFGTSTDIDAQIRHDEVLRMSEEREREARAEAERANRAKDEFLAVLSHELRTPMTSILGWTSMMQQGLLDNDTMELAVRSLHDSALAQARLIDDLLDITRISSGKIGLQMDVVDLVAAVGSVVQSFRWAATSRGLDVRISIQKPALHIIGDEKRIRQIISNLLSNALKFTERGGTVEVRLLQSGSSVAIEVRDTGVGINPEFLPRIFERFAQQDPSNTRKQGGLGLGLTIVRQLVMMQGGTIFAHSDGHGHGARFTVTFPLFHLAEQPAASTAPEMALPRLDGVRVLLVDDERMARDYMEAVLESFGATVFPVGSAAEALLADVSPQIVVSDIVMPDEDGFSLIGKLRLRDVATRTPVLAVSALEYDANRDRILAAGFDHYLAKPVDPVVLVRAVAKLTAR
jgi:PAS domain S-box-containing protein